MSKPIYLWREVSVRNVTSFLALVGLLCACSPADVTPESPELASERLIAFERRAAIGDTRAIRGILSSREVAEDDQLTLKWADRLARLGDPEGYSLAAHARVAIANKAAMSDPERLILLREAKAFGEEAAKSKSDVYGHLGHSVRWLDAEIAGTETAIEQKHGKLPAA